MNPLTERYPDLLGEDADPALTRLVADLDAVCAPHPLPPRRDAVIARTIEEEITMHGTIAIAPALGRAGSVPRAVRTPRRIAWAAVAVAAALPFLLLIALLIMRGRVPSATPQPGTHTQLPSGRAVVAPAPGPSQAISARPGTWTMTGSMHQARAFQTTTLLPNGLVLVAGGADSNGFLASAELYHPRTGSWATTGSMHQSRLEYTATLLRDGQVLVTGGGSSNGDPARAELYNPQTGKWTLTGAMREPRIYHTATLLPDGRVLVAGGVTGGCDSNGTCSGIQASAELYDPRTGTWTLTGSMRQARARQTATLLPSGLVLVAGGAAGGANTAGADLLVSAELYTPRTGAWTLTGSMHTAAGARGATLLPSGLVLVDGGFDGNTWITDAELYHPRTGTWTVTGSLHDPRGYQTGQTATLLGNGKVLVVGGCPTGVCSSVLASAELYNPQTGIWTLTGSLHQSRAWQPATLLASGLVLVAGGSRSFDGSTSLASVELYHP
jgi:hypothetical protein